MRQEITDFDHYAVSCVEDEQHGERFVILFANLAEGTMKRMIGPFTEEELRSEFEPMGLTHKADVLIQQARAHRDAERSASIPA
jgi:hypothetical protein